jgi:hypothetical protein
VSGIITGLFNGESFLLILPSFKSWKIE